MYTWEEIENDKEAIAEKFKWLFFYESDTIEPNTWMGRRIQKNPLDLFIYAEIAHEVKPRLVVETGSFWGGSAVWWADIMKLIHGDESGKVISIDPNALDIDTSGRNIQFINSSSLNGDTFAQVTIEARNGPVLVNLDSLHDAEHVYNEMKLYSQLVTPSSYMIVEDGIINGHPTHPEYGPGPYEACERFLSEHPEFTADRRRERMIVTANPMGFLDVISLVIPHMPSVATDAALDACLASFKGHYDELILVVNNGIGYGPAVNQGLKYASGDYIVVSNNDIELLTGELETLTYWDGFVIPTIVPEPKDYKPRPIFCMSRAIYEKILERDGFFYDPAFEVGYWEDDDLHMRTKDIKSIRAEPVVVSHFNGGGLTMKQMGEQHWHDTNQKIFNDKWS